MHTFSVFSGCLKHALPPPGVIPDLNHSVALRLAAAGALLIAVHAHAQTEVALPLPQSIQFGQCRPVNIGDAEMAKQWELHYRYAKRMHPSSALIEAERNSLAAQAMAPERIECFVGNEVFAGLCFTSARSKRLEIRAVKLMHAPSWADCLALVTAIKRK